MKYLTAVAAVALWDTKKFSTYEIAEVLAVHEAEIEKLLHFTRDERRRRRA